MPVLHDGTPARVHHAPQALMAVHAQRKYGLAIYQLVPVGNHAAVMDPAHAGAGCHIDGAVGSLRKVTDVEKAVFLRAGHLGEGTVFIDEHTRIAAADPQPAGGILIQGADGLGGDGPLRAEVPEACPVIAQQAAEAAHPQVAVLRLQDGVGLVGGKAVGLIEHSAHICRLTLRGPGRGAAQHRQHKAQQPRGKMTHSHCYHLLRGNSMMLHCNTFTLFFPSANHYIFI